MRTDDEIANLVALELEERNAYAELVNLWYSPCDRYRAREKISAAYHRWAVAFRAVDRLFWFDLPSDGFFLFDDDDDLSLIDADALNRNEEQDLFRAPQTPPGKCS